MQWEGGSSIPSVGGDICIFMENSMDKGVWQPTVHGVAELGTTVHTHT